MIRVADEQQKLDTQFQRGADRAGKINFDDRGNAFFEWRDDLSGDDNDAAQRRRDQALENPGLSLVDEGQPEPSTDASPRDCRIGYNPYESGVLDRKAPPKKKRDLRELSKWIEAKRRVDGDSK